MSTSRIALVTGGNRGIGLEIARALGHRGLLVAIGARNSAEGQLAADHLRSQGLDPVVVALDVTDEMSVRASVAQVQDLFGRCDVLVNNAGVLLDRRPGETWTATADIAISDVWRTLDVNTVGALRMIQAVLPLMQANNYGRIVNMSSGLGQLSTMGHGSPAYRMSKTALNALTRTLAAELGDGPIKVNAASPGWVRTEMGGPQATSTVEEGADTAVWLATLPEDGPTGGFFQDRQPFPW